MPRSPWTLLLVLALSLSLPSLCVGYSHVTHARTHVVVFSSNALPLTHPLTPPTQTLVSQKESSWTAAGDGPTAGVAQYNATLNGYSFHFKNAANAATFAADPWTWAPAWGGF